MPIKFEVRFTRSAKKDVEELLNHIAKDNPERAKRFISQLEQQIQTLELFPKRCPLIPENEVLDQKYRHFIQGKYRTIFRIDQETVYITRVIHGARLLEISTLH